MPDDTRVHGSSTGEAFDAKERAVTRHPRNVAAISFATLRALTGSPGQSEIAVTRAASAAVFFASQTSCKWSEDRTRNWP